MRRCDVTEEAAESEPAWKGCGQEVGLQIWRIVVSGVLCAFLVFCSHCLPQHILNILTSSRHGRINRSEGPIPT